MAQKKKKTKANAKKSTSGSAKKKLRGVAKKVVKSSAKKKSISVTKKKSNSPIKRKAAIVAKTKTKRPIRLKMAPADARIKDTVKETTLPEETKQSEVEQPITAANEITPSRMEEIKILEHRFENREQAIMSQENQRVKSAMANRQDTKRVFHTQRHK